MFFVELRLCWLCLVMMVPMVHAVLVILVRENDDHEDDTYQHVNSVKDK